MKDVWLGQGENDGWRRNGGSGGDFLAWMDGDVVDDCGFHGMLALGGLHKCYCILKQVRCHTWLLRLERRLECRFAIE